MRYHNTSAMTIIMSILQHRKWTDSEREREREREREKSAYTCLRLYNDRVEEDEANDSQPLTSTSDKKTKKASPYKDLIGWKNEDLQNTWYQTLWTKYVHRYPKIFSVCACRDRGKYL